LEAGLTEAAGAIRGAGAAVANRADLAALVARQLVAIVTQGAGRKVRTTHAVADGCGAGRCAFELVLAEGVLGNAGGAFLNSLAGVTVLHWADIPSAFAVTVEEVSLVASDARRSRSAVIAVGVITFHYAGSSSVRKEVALVTLNTGGQS